MNFLIAQLWQYLKENGVVRVKIRNGEFELLLYDNSVVSPKHIWERIGYEISKKRPKKVVAYRKPISTPWGDDDIYPPRIKEVMGFATREDKILDEKCDEELTNLKLRWNDLQELFHLVSFGVQQIPPSLSVVKEVKQEEPSEATRHPRLKLAPNKKEELYQRIRDDLEALYDTGRYQNWNEVYTQLAQISKEKYRAILKGKSLTPGQIKGIKVNKTRFAPKSP